jgi:hypothetical protein
MQPPISSPHTALVVPTQFVSGEVTAIGVETPDANGGWRQTMHIVTGPRPTDHDLRELGRAVWIAVQ